MAEIKKDPYQSAYTGEQIDNMLGGSIQRSKLSQAEYDALLKAGKIESDRWYMIYRDQAKTFLMKIYIGRLLFATRGDKLSTGFPYVFPIVFIS